jgi:restriction endonuclease S subunit
LSSLDRSTWRTVRLGEVANIFRGGSPRPIQDYITTASNGINWIKIGDVRMEDKYIRSTEEKIKTEGESKSRRVCPGDFLLSNSMSFGRPYILQIDGCIHDGWLTIQNYDKDFDLDFLYYLLSSDLIYEQYLENVAGSSVKNLNKESVSNLILPCPDLTIQKQIAQRLDTIAKQMESLRRLIAKQEAIKKSTLKLLMTPKEGWLTARLEEVCSSFAYGVSASATSFDGVNKYIRITDIDDETQQFVPTPLASPQFFSEEDFLHPGDIVFARTGASVGKTYLYNRKDGRLIYAGFLIKASVDSSKANPGFVFLQTIMPKYKQWIATESARTGQPGINVGQLKKLPIIMPQCINTQNNIVDTILAEDQKLVCLRKLLKKAYTVKSGMMRYFFGD